MIQVARPACHRDKGAASLSQVLAIHFPASTYACAWLHDFRSSFRDWAGNVSSFPREVTETALAHVIGDKAEQASRA